MRFRAGVLVGFGLGYYYGSKAGRERFVQIERLLQRIGAADSIDVATEKARAVLDLGMERARDLLGGAEDPDRLLPDRSRGLQLQPPADPSLN
ncbi:MAG: hypothetical protein JWM05_2644 [Acidimicrobiales bacterium]|nr:hypothetical protein [Acidimicrobiales bacterium]